jgi:ribonuclease P/MRP protein subunit POP5
VKHLPKHLRPRYRYLAVELASTPDASLSRRSLQRELWYAAGNLLGDAGSADADCTVVRFEFSDGTGEAVVRARHGQSEAARAALACVASVDGHDLGVVVRGISGTIRACEEKYLGRPRQSSAQRTVAFEGGEVPAVERNGVLDVRVDDRYVGATNTDFE